jgi:hypothetical protein
MDGTPCRDKAEREPVNRPGKNRAVTWWPTNGEYRMADLPTSVGIRAGARASLGCRS